MYYYCIIVENIGKKKNDALTVLITVTRLWFFLLFFCCSRGSYNITPNHWPTHVVFPKLHEYSISSITKIFIIFRRFILNTRTQCKSEPTPPFDTLKYIAVHTYKNSCLSVKNKTLQNYPRAIIMKFFAKRFALSGEGL